MAKRNWKAPQIKGGRSVLVSFWATPEQVLLLDHIAKEDGCSRAQVVRKLANAGLKKRAAEQVPA